jgi:hypothetical protein
MKFFDIRLGASLLGFFFDNAICPKRIFFGYLDDTGCHTGYNKKEFTSDIGTYAAHAGTAQFTPSF